MILVFGTVCLDRIRHVTRLPMPGGYVEVESEAVVLGGEAANTAAHLLQWNAEVELLGNSIGADADGALLAGCLAEKGLEYDLYAVPAAETPRCDIYVTPDGERTMFGLGFSRMSAASIETFEPRANDWFTTDANLNDVAEAYAARAKASGMKLYLMDLPVSCELLGPGVYWQSSTRWVGERGNTKANMDFTDEVAGRTGCTAVLTDAGNGFVVAGAGRQVRLYPPFPRAAALDSTGAGDTFRAGMLQGLDQDWPEGQCLAFASAAASLAAGYVGAAEGPSRSEVEAHIAANPDIARQYD